MRHPEHTPPVPGPKTPQRPPEPPHQLPAPLANRQTAVGWPPAKQNRRTTPGPEQTSSVSGFFIFRFFPPKAALPKNGGKWENGGALGNHHNFTMGKCMKLFQDERTMENNGWKMGRFQTPAPVLRPPFPPFFPVAQGSAALLQVPSYKCGLPSLTTGKWGRSALPWGASESGDLGALPEGPPHQRMVHPEGTRGYCTCAQEAVSTKRRKRLGSSVA